MIIVDIQHKTEAIEMSRRFTTDTEVEKYIRQKTQQGFICAVRRNIGTPIYA